MRCAHSLFQHVAIKIALRLSQSAGSLYTSILFKHNVGLRIHKRRAYALALRVLQFDANFGGACQRKANTVRNSVATTEV